MGGVGIWFFGGFKDWGFRYFRDFGIWVSGVSWDFNRMF